MKKLIVIIFIIYSSFTFAQIPSGYYDSANGLEGNNLKMELRSIISANYHSVGYDGLYNVYQTSDNYTNGKVWDMYSMHNDGTANYWFTHFSDKCGSYSNEGDCYNREHTIPQSWGLNSTQKADAFIVIPTDGKVNGMRSSLPYGETTSANWTSTNGSKRGGCSYAGYSGTIFEPIDRFKGDIARGYFYAATRYNVSSLNGASFNGDGFSSWTLNMLLEWNANDPVSQKEIDRNNAIYPYQHNRNPYIDHPEWVECVFGGNCNGLNFTSTPITSAMENQTYTYNITYNDDAGAETLTCTKPGWLTFSKDESNNTALLTGTPSSSDIGNHNVVLTLTENGETETQSFTIVVSPYSVIQDIIDVDFSSCPPANWETVSVTSNKNWTCDSETYSINGYNGDVASNDWFISPELNLNDYENENLTFKTWLRYSDDGVTDPEVKLKYSTNYTGNGNPNSATWATLSYNYPTSNQQQTWKQSGDIDLSSINGTSVHIAFHYTSSGTTAGEAAWWKIDDIFLQGNVVESVDYLNSGIKIFPNPANNILNINSETNFINISVINIIGKEVFHISNIQTKTYPLNINNLQSGIYILNIKDNNGNTTIAKFVKK